MPSMTPATAATGTATIAVPAYRALRPRIGLYPNVGLYPSGSEIVAATTSTGTLVPA